jgi:thymidylate synthase (FAD)
MHVVRQEMTLEHITPEALKLIEKAGRISWRSEGKIGPGTEKAFVKMLKKAEHESVIEHAHATFRVVTDRGTSHSLVRHRLASYTMESTRYCNYSKEKFEGQLQIILPVRFEPLVHVDSKGLIREKPGLDIHSYEYKKYSHWLNGMSQAEVNYLRSIALGEKPEEARGFLPHDIKTELYWTANLREWMHIFKMRRDKHAHPQVRALIEQAWLALNAQIPELFE